MATEHPTWSNQRIGEALDPPVSETSVRRGLHAAGFKRYLIPTDNTYSERFSFDLDTPIEVYGPVMISADWHIPLYDPELVNKMIVMAREQGLTQLIIGGDFFNFDSLSQYDPKQTDAGLEREVDEAHAVMRVLLETFDDIYYVWGNHDARLHRALSFKLQFKKAMRLVFGELGEAALERIHFTNLDHVIARPYPGAADEISWYICHPQNYSRIPGTTARTLTAKYRMNVITMHSHHCGIVPGFDGKTVAIEGGGLFDRHKTAYLKRSNTFPFWTQGFCYLDEDNIPHLKSPLFNV